jgi:predicted transcriptional regulator
MKILSQQNLQKMKRIINSTERKFYDEYGNLQVETTSKTVVHKTTEDSFYMTFTNYIMWMYQVKSISTLKVLNKLLENAEFNTGNVDITTGFRSQIETDLQISKSQITRSVSELVEKEVLLPRTEVNKDTGEERILKGCYTINPTMFWKGDLKKRTELKVTFETTYSSDEN